MRIEDPALRFAPDAEFRFVGGDASVDLVNTVNWTARGLGRDRMTDYGRVLEWARGAAIVSPAEERSLRRNADSHPRQAAKAHERVLEARGVLQRVFAASAGRRIGADDIGALNALILDAVPRIRLVRAPGGRVAQGWEGFGESLDSVLWSTVWRAGNLLLSDEAEQLRICAGTDCGWMYVDRSRNGMRRWCEMGVCGTAAKNRRRAGKR